MAGSSRETCRRINQDMKAKSYDENNQRVKKEGRGGDGNRRKRLGPLHSNSGELRGTRSTTNDAPKKLLSKSLDFPGSGPFMKRSGSFSSLGDGSTNHGASEAKGYTRDVRRSHDLGLNQVKKSEFSFDLSVIDESICRQTATLAYSAQNTLECDFELAHCLQITFMEHDRILAQHAGIVRMHAENARERAISEWLKSRTKEEQIQYLSHYGKTITG
jgi:hypothetical protein